MANVAGKLKRFVYTIWAVWRMRRTIVGTLYLLHKSTDEQRFMAELSDDEYERALEHTTLDESRFVRVLNWMGMDHG